MTESKDAEDTTMSMDEYDEFTDTIEEDPTNRYDACRWLRKIVGVVAARDLPAEASIEAFREALKSGIILCNVINKIQPGLVRKVVKAPSAVFTTPDEAAQSAYSENIRNFLIAIEELGLPTFEPSDIEPGGDFSRVVNTLLVLKTYSESGSRKSSWISKASQSGKSFARRNSEPTISRSQSASEKSFNTTDQYGDGNESNEERDSGSLYMIVCDLLEDREEEDIRIIIENILNRVKEEFESRLSVHSTIEPSREVTKPKEKDESNEKKEEASIMAKKEEADQEAVRVKKEQKRIDREKKEKHALQEKAKKQEEERIKEEELIKKERELLTKQELARKQQEEEAEKAAKEQERIKREKELLAQQEMAKKQEEERIRREEENKRLEEERKRIEEERIRREEELLAQQEMAKKEEEERKRREEELLAQQEMDKKEQEERIKREEELRVQREKADRKEEKRRKKEEARLKREEERLKREEEIRVRREEAKRKADERKREKREQKEKDKREKQERIKKEKELRVQKERERREQERIQRQKELFAIHEKAKQAELSALEVERKNKEREFLEEEERLKREEEELERIEREAEEERTRKKEEYKIRKDEYSKVNIDTTKRKEVLGQEDKELKELRNTISGAKTDVRSMQTNCQEEADNLGTHVHTLCQAAAGYKKVLEENRKLYNQVQDLKGSIRVYCRVRPFLAGQENNVTSVDYMDDETVTIITPSKSGKEGRKASMFNKVFGPSATQEDVFSDTGPLIRSVLDGFNVCIFACGQTGSGKTYTLTGPDDLTPETMGVNFRALTDLFSISEERKNLVSYEISINMVEIYNDEIRDLLVTDGTSKILDITNGTKKGINLPEANLVRVSSIDDVINLMNLCKKNRVGNDHSSRSHSFVTVHVFGKDITAGTTTRGCMHVVDLAGSEKVDTSDDEATHVNKSLSALGDILVAIANKSSRVPYKACKLTQLLQDAIGAQSKILMFVHVHPDIDEAGETLSTFKFVERFSTVEGGCGKSPEVRELKEQICYLKAVLAKKESGDSSWQELATSSPKGGDGEDSSNPKPPTKSPSLKKLTPGAVAATKSKQATTADSKKKKGK